QEAEDDADAEMRQRPDDDRQPDQDHQERHPAHQGHVHQAAFRPAATMTRDGAFLSTYSTVGPKIVFHPPRRAPSTMISVARRSASSTIARPALRARTTRSTTRTPYG